MSSPPPLKTPQHPPSPSTAVFSFCLALVHQLEKSVAQPRKNTVGSEVGPRLDSNRVRIVKASRAERESEEFLFFFLFFFNGFQQDLSRRAKLKRANSSCHHSNDFLIRVTKKKNKMLNYCGEMASVRATVPAV